MRGHDLQSKSANMLHLDCVRSELCVTLYPNNASDAHYSFRFI